MTNSTTSLFQMNITTEEKTKAQELLKDKYGINLTDYFKMQLKKLLNTELLNVDYTSNFREPTLEENQIIHKFEEKLKTENFKGQTLEETKKEIDWLN